ncbi:lipid scramblase CLPTM1L [Prorops nasuta]|uniref:lipid scramblase CLPTM1L n=1 Tax=Prorops nasuta TaxID=863751 RepID=UPI0034CFCAEF
MRWPSINLILAEVFLGFILYLMYSLSLLFVSPSCEEGNACLSSYFNKDPKLQLYIFSSLKENINSKNIKLIYTIPQFNYSIEQSIPIELNIPRKTRLNGTLFLHTFVVPDNGKYDQPFNELIRNPLLSKATIQLSQYTVPKADVFNLLGNKNTAKNQVDKISQIEPVTHIKSKVVFTLMTEKIKLPMNNIPFELLPNIKITRDYKFLPIVYWDFLHSRYRDLIQVSPQNDKINITILFRPISIGKLRLILHVETGMHSLKNLGFSDKDTDDIKEIFADINVYLLVGTFFIAAVHLMFDFLAFKSDINFWRKKNNLAGLSTRSIMWRSFSQTVIFLYLFDQGSSLLILVPAGIATAIEMWKLKKIFRVEIIRGPYLVPKIKFKSNLLHSAEKQTEKFDAEIMHYLKYVLYPLVIAGAVYSLLYQPHKSWYSWSINSLVNGIYAIGFIFMLPQLFINYKLKSVSQLPWKVFMYKAFNTFIDDVFAFIITTPTAHRIACLRDDVIFVIYLYQRWLYPVDKSRNDDIDAIGKEVNINSSIKKEN